MTHVTLCLPIDIANRQVLLGLKKRGFGQGKWVGLGGKIEPGETLAAAAVRELYEEAGLLADPGRIEQVARLTFCFPTRPDWDQLMHVFIVREWQGEPRESEEIAPQWQPIDDLPFDRMWDDGRRWLPRVLAGERLVMTCVYREDLETIAEVTFSDLIATIPRASRPAPAADSQLTRRPLRGAALRTPSDHSKHDVSDHYKICPLRSLRLGARRKS